MIIRTLLDEQKSKANKLSDGEAIILLDDILKRQGREEMENLFNNDMRHIKDRIINGSFDLSGCKNINTDLANEIIALTQKGALLNTLNVNNTVSQPKKKRI
ncbi:MULTISPECIES: hypothetical protein [Pantoea]|jgi:hypothetical protein|uniref:Uncharacterized protein n=1 Tax=Pantoea brenneri TaxID=472694 RepID=A0A7Y6NIA0_9GAMM|nr:MULTISPECIES: hypothetical protein [Pantoea]MBZ6397588.1 hypothetical protein [Pantoea sp.]MBZ6440737.1 hypothetical protein [Pantoea sp.]NUY44157.1 hypothetical protein [Pantoea brenneri]NUY51684.1 hypothetical protein [Pantoea brenneri]NUY61978.1 hypothetical protein [Pantoea brenneri]